MHVEISIVSEQWSSSARNQGHDKWMSLNACGSIHEGREWFSDDSRGRRDFYVFGRSIMWAILPIRQWRCLDTVQDIHQVPLHEIIFFSQCIQQQWSVDKKLLPLRVNCRLKLAGLEEKREETVKPTCFMSKATSVPHTPQAAQALFVIYIRDSIALRLNHLRECKSHFDDLNISRFAFH